MPLKTFQRLGYFVQLHNVPKLIAEYISLLFGAQIAEATFPRLRKPEKTWMTLSLWLLRSWRASAMSCPASALSWIPTVGFGPKSIAAISHGLGIDFGSQHSRRPHRYRKPVHSNNSVSLYFHTLTDIQC
jgi:hypothetical protein